MSLDEWLATLLGDYASWPQHFIYWDFPSDEHHREFIARVEHFTEEELREVLRYFLVESSELGADEKHFNFLQQQQNKGPGAQPSVMRTEFNRRLLRYKYKLSKAPPWEGNTWVLDLLPDHPKQALEAVSAYILAHIQMLPDGRLCGLSSVLEIIRARYIGQPSNAKETLDSLLSITDRDFEHVVEELYSQMGYETELTPRQKDGGRDVITRNRSPGRLEHLAIECKRHKGRVGVQYVRELAGVALKYRVNKAVLVATTNFTRPAREWVDDEALVELLSGKDLVTLLNEHIGPRWPLQLERLVLNSKRRHESRTG